jgi:dipeptidyl aminopeptidase/acylaminoacyl peptidase
MTAILATLIGAAFAQETPAQPSATAFVFPDDVSVRKETIWSDGTRLAANVLAAKGSPGKLPTIVMAYGWGGTKEKFRAESSALAEAGYLVVMFDYRGWGESDGRVILTGAAPQERHGNRFTAEVMELREIMDPMAEAEDLFNVIHWLQAEPQSDTTRLGLWGSSFGGGIAAYVAGQDPRVRAIHVQMAPLDLRALDSFAFKEGTRRARGLIGYPKPGLVVVQGPRGAPISERFLRYSPARVMNLNPDCAIQVILAGNEELFDTKPTTAAYDEFKGTKKKLVVIQGITHYDAYGKERAQVLQLAITWFDKNLKQ